MRKLSRIFFNFFIPHEHNNFRARLLHLDVLLLHFFIGVLLLVAVNKMPLTGRVLGFATDITLEKLLLLTNKARADYNLPPLALDGKLSQAATLKGHDMIIKNYWAHYAPDGRTPWSFLNAAGYDYEYAGENLAKNFLYSDNVVTAWMASASHRENILRPEYTQVGFAIVNGKLEGEDTTLVVQFFGRPQGTKAPVAEKPATAQKETKPLIAAKPANPVVNPQTLSSQNPVVPNLSIPVNFVSLVIMFLLATFALDLYFASRLKVFHIHGKNIAHLIFLGFIFAGFVIMSKGIIL